MGIISNNIVTNLVRVIFALKNYIIRRYYL